MSLQERSTGSDLSSTGLSAVSLMLRFLEDIAPDDSAVLLLHDVGGRKKRKGWTTVSALTETLTAAVCDGVAASEIGSFAVRAPGDLLVLDMDNPAAVDTLDLVRTNLETLGMSPVVMASGRLGNLHLFCRVPDRSHLRMCAALAKTSGIDVRTGSFIRPPFSPHTLPDLVPKLVQGAPGDLRRAQAQPTDVVAVTPVEVSAASAVIEVDGLEVREKLRPLTPRMAHVLKHGDPVLGDRSATMQSLLTAMVNAQWPTSEMWSALANTRYQGGAKLQEVLRTRGRDAGHRYFTLSLERAREFVKANPVFGLPAKDSDVLTQFWQAAEAQVWPGREGSSDWVVLFALFQIGARGVGLELSASERQLAELSGMSRTGVHKSLERLQLAQWVLKVRSGVGDKATLWRLNRAKARGSEPITQPGQSVGCENWWVSDARLVAMAGHDVFRVKGFGPLGYRVVVALADSGWLSVAELSCRLGPSAASINRLLRGKLAAHGVVQYDSGRWALFESVERLSARLGPLAETLGTAGDGELARRRHHYERVTYRRTASLSIEDQAAWEDLERRRMADRVAVVDSLLGRTAVRADL